MPEKSASEQPQAYEEQFLLLVALQPEAKRDCAKLAQQIQEIDKAFMDRYRSEGFLTRFAQALIGPYDFAVLYRGNAKSALNLSALIAEKFGEHAETLTMPAVDLDAFNEMFAAR